MSEYTAEDGGLRATGTFSFQKIHVIEFLADSDVKTGKILFDTILKPQEQNNDWLTVEFSRVDNPTELMELLGSIKDDMEQNDYVPILHFETHGNRDGMGKDIKNFVPYDDLLIVFQEMNKIAKNNMFIVAAACEGVHLMKVLTQSITDRAPFWGILGPKVEVTDKCILNGFSAFYEECFSSKRTSEGLKKLKEACPDQGAEFQIVSSEDMFLLAFKYYLKDQCTPSRLNERLGLMRIQFDELVRQAGISVDFDVFEQITRDALTKQDSQKKFFEQFKHTFFYHDLYEENKVRCNPQFSLLGGL